MFKWIRKTIAKPLIKLYLWMDRQEISQKDMTVKDWGKVKEIAEKEIALSKKIQSYAIEQSNTPLNQERGGSATLRVVKNETTDMTRPLKYDRDNNEIYLKRRLVGLGSW